jgi:hypothetical protein
MIRPSLVRSVVAIIAAALLALAGSGAAIAQGSDTASHPIVGTWRVTLGDDPHVHGLLTHHADGTMTSSDPVTMAVEPGMVAYQSGAYGAWEVTGPNTIAYTYQQFNSDADGNVVGIVTVSGTREVSADGQSFTGAGIYQVADVDGNVLFSAPAPDVRGERMTIVPIESMATPAG